MMATKTERITFLGTPDLKELLINQAKEEGVSLSELIRRRCLGESTDEDTKILMGLIRDVKEATKRAKESLNKGIADAEAVISELRAGHECS